MSTMLLPLLLSALLPADGSRIEVPHELFTLGNGLQVVLAPDHSLPRVEVNLWYHVGSKDEAPGRSGFAHLFEHLMFMGTERVPTGQYDQIMEGGGGANNATTSEDRTNYFDWGPSSLLETLLWLESDRLQGLGVAMTQEKLDLQRDVVRNERRQTSENTPYGKADLLVSELMYPPGHPYHISVIGTHEDLEAATVKDVQDFFARHYLPNNATLTVVGDFDPKRARELVQKYFGDLQPGPQPPRVQVDPVVLDGPRRITLEDKVQYPRLSFVFHSPPFAQPGDAEMDLVADVLAGGKSSRLYQRLVVQDGTATDVASFQESRQLGSLFHVDVYATPDADLAKVEAAVREELARLAKEGPTDEELQRSLAGIEMRTVSSLQSLHARADRLNQYLMLWGDPDGFERDLDRYRRATPATVASWARSVLDLDRGLTMTVLPEGSQPAGSARDTRPTAASAPAKFTPPVPKTSKRDSGLTLWTLPRPGLPLVEIALVLPSGRLAEPAGAAGLATLTASMLEEGAGDRDALAFAQALEQLGADFSASAGPRSTTLQMQVLKHNLDPALELFHDALTRPRIEASDFERVRRLQVDDLKQALDDPNTLARQVAAAAWYGSEHPYGRPAGGYPETVSALSREQVIAFHKGIARPDGALLVIAGDVSADEAASIAQRLDQSWPKGGTALQDAPTPQPPAPKPRLLLLDRPGAPQTVVRFVMPGQAGRDPNRLAGDVLNTLFGGSFTSRLNQNLREQHGYTYGARSGFVRLPDQGTFSASSAVRTDVTGASLAEFGKEFVRLRGGDVTADEVAKARSTVEADIVADFEGLGPTVNLWLGLRERGSGPDEVAQDLAQLPSITADSLNALAEQLVDTDHALLVLVGDGAQVQPQLDGLPLPLVERVDERGRPAAAPAATGGTGR